MSDNPTPWCCTGFAAFCPLCEDRTGVTVRCPGHPDTDANRETVRVSDLHARFRHPDYEYRMTEGPRKQWDDADTPPRDDAGNPEPGWERNVDAGHLGWERFDYTEESYWRRRKPQAERSADVACAVLHTDGEGNTIPCPGYPHASDATPDRPSLPSGDPDCPQLLRKVPHDAHGYEGRHCHGVSLSDDEGRPEPPSEDELNDALPVRPDPRQPAYDAVYEYIRKLGGYLPPDPVHRNAVIWRAVNAALGATPVGRCISSHCVEGDHILPVEGEAP